MARYHRLVVAVWIVVVVGSAILVPRFQSSVTGPPLDVLASDSYRAQEILATRFDQPFAEQDLIVFESESLVATDLAFQAVIGTALDRVEQLPGVVSVISPFDPRAEGLVAEEGHVATAVVGLSGSNAERQALAPRLTQEAASAATDEVRVYVTGRSPLIAELVAQQEAGSLAGGAAGTASRAPDPLDRLGRRGRGRSAAGAGDVRGDRHLRRARRGVDVHRVQPVRPEHRFHDRTWRRHRLRAVHRQPFPGGVGRGAADPRLAVTTTTATAGRTVFFSGLTVLLSLAGLLLVDARIFRELALGAMTAVAVMALGALTLVPALLSWLGPRVNALRLPGRNQQSVSFGGDRFWSRWARMIMRQPRLWAAVAIIILLALAAPVTRLNLALDTGTSDIGQQSAGLGREILEREFNEGRISPLQVVYVSNDGPLDEADLDAIARLSELLSNDYAVVGVTSVTTLLDRFVGDHSAESLELAAGFPQVVEASGDLINLASGGDVAVIRAVPRWSPDSPGPLQLVTRVRDVMVPNVLETQHVNAEVLVGGLSAQIVDITAESLRKLPVVVGLVVVLSFVLLALVFRSIAIPIKAILMNVLGITAAYGLLVVVFQEGAGARLFDFQVTGTTQVYLPLLTFAVLFGLSMDYEVFLLGRIKEEWEKTGDNQTAVERGLQRTGAVITAAAAIMVSVFAAFTFARLTEVKTLGFSLAAAVLIDATLIRIILVPAAMQLLGRWNWWFPPWLDRRLPRFDLAE